MSLAIGTKIADFSCLADDGELRALSDARGRWLVVFFYPRASTPGCTIESRDFSALAADFDAAGCTVWGCSTDSIKRQCNFRDKQNLTVPLLADESKVVHEAFGVWQEKKLYGRLYMGTVRATFLIDPSGKLAASWPKVKVNGHAQAVLEALKEQI